ncbi:MAG: cupin domain-containing protein, partial [Deltaproteobacteria bacterium]|nr:cupin domain-containing protein [Deltaproteobacteria bacterium]
MQCFATRWRVLNDALVFADLLSQTRQADFSWSVLRPGVDEHRLYGTHDGTGPVASVLRYSPGARVSHHRHTGFEHVFILHGSQRDERGIHRAGSLVINPPGTTHEVVSDDGCTALL